MVSSSAASVFVESFPTGSPSRRLTETELTCSARAFDSRGTPDSSGVDENVKHEHVSACQRQSMKAGRRRRDVGYRCSAVRLPMVVLSASSSASTLTAAQIWLRLLSDSTSITPAAVSRPSAR